MTIDFNTLRQSLLDYIWQQPRDELTGWQRRLQTALRIGHLLIRDLLEGQITLRAMGLVYTTLLALVPLLAVSFSVLKGFGVHNQIEPLLNNLLQPPLGEKGVEITNRIIEFVDNIKAGVLGSLGMALLLFTAISLMQKIERAFNYTWRVSERRSLAHRFSDYVTVVLIGPVLVFTALGITASISSIESVQHLLEIKTIGFLFEVLGRLLPYLMVIATFMLIYLLVPHTKVKVSAALTGAVVAGILWESTSWLYAAFVVNSTKYTAIYSAFATVILFMIWLHLSWMILLIGCSIAFYYQHPEARNLRGRSLRLSNRMREKLGLLILVIIGQHYYQHKPAWTIDALAKRLNISVEICQRLLNQLVQVGLLVRASKSPTTYLPAYAPETISVADILTELRQLDETASLCPDTIKSIAPVDKLYADMETAIGQAVAELSLRDLAIGVDTRKHDADQ